MEELVIAMRGGDATARQRIILLHEGLACNAAKRHKDKQDAQQEAMLAIIRAVDEFQGPPSEISKYLAAAAYNAAMDVFRNNMRHLARLHRKYACGLSTRKVASEDDEQRTFHNVQRRALKTITLFEFVDAVCENELEKRIVDLKNKGHTNKEVSAITGYSEQKVGRILHALEERWDQ